MRSNVVFRPTVVIGLGGTGFGTVLKLKRQFIDAYGSVPPIIRFLTIDTTENTEHSEKARDGTIVRLEPNEEYVLSIPNPAGLVSGTNEHIDEWWPRNIPINAIVAGAGQVRARGRLALFAKAGDIFGRIRRAIDEVMAIKNKKRMYTERFHVSNRGGVEVYIVGSLAGGTGSGIFLDVAFIARNYLDSESNITGVMVLPRIFQGLPGVQLVKSNAYAALKEIEHFAKMEPRDQFSIDYGTARVDVRQPPFNLLYLIDGINESGRVVGETSDLLALVAQGVYLQIGSQIGTDSENTVDNIKNHLSAAGRVRGRSASYCSFGVGTLSLPVRQLHGTELDAARRLLLDGLMSGAFPEDELEADVVKFINDNKLREDEADEVIDALSEREGGGQMRFPMSIAQVKHDRTAQNTLKQLHATHRSKMERQVAQGLDANYQTLVQTCARALDEWWERAINRPNGVTYATRFLEKLIAKVEWYQQMMANEAKEEQARTHGLSFKAAEEQIQEAASAFFRAEAKVRAASESYKGIVDRECDHYLQQARREKAAELYAALRRRAEDILLRCGRIQQNLKTAASRVEQAYMDATASRGGESPFEHTVRFDIDTHRPALPPEEFIKWRMDNHGSLAEWADVRQEDVHREIEAFVKERLEPVTGMSIDEVLRRLKPQQVVQDMNQLDGLAVPLWRYDEGRIPVVNKGVIQEMYHYGVEDADKTALADAALADRVPRGVFNPSFVSTQDSQRIVLFKVKVGIPLFALRDIEEMERAYNDPDKVISNHVHREWEAFPAVIPRAGDGEALRWFAIAQAPEPLGTITRRGEWYYIRSRQARRVDGGELKLGQGRVAASQAFEKNRDLVTEFKEQVEGITRSQGEARVSSVLREYVDSLVKQISERGVDPGVKEQVEREVEEIERHLDEMTKLR
jgi:hypothetical protein